MTGTHTIDPPLSLQAIQDRYAIEAALWRYRRGVDRKDEELIRSAYHDDAIDNHGTFDGPASEFITQLMPRLRMMEISFHGLFAPWIEVQGETAVVETPFFGLIRMPIPLPDGPLKDMYQIGRYLDRFEKRHGVWKIAHRQLVVENTRFVDPPTAELPDFFRNYMAPRSAPDDFAYARWAELAR